MTPIGPNRRDALGLIGAGAAAMVGCAPRDGRPTLQFWAMGNEGAAVPNILPEFEAQTGVRVVVQPQPWSSAHQKLLTAYAGSSLPDVSQIGATWISELTAIGALSPTPPEAVDLLTDQFLVVLDTASIEGRSMATPWYVDTRLIYVRTDILRQAGYDTIPTN